MSTGAITIWDLPFTIIMYTFLTMSRLHLMRPTPLFAIFLASFVFYMYARPHTRTHAWLAGWLVGWLSLGCTSDRSCNRSAIRRIMIYEAAIRVRGVEPRYDTRLWVMPSNSAYSLPLPRARHAALAHRIQRLTVQRCRCAVWPGFYYVMYHKFGEQIRIATTVWTDYYYLRITECTRLYLAHMASPPAREREMRDAYLPTCLPPASSLTSCRALRQRCSIRAGCT